MTYGVEHENIATRWQLTPHRGREERKVGYSEEFGEDGADLSRDPASLFLQSLRDLW